MTAAALAGNVHLLPVLDRFLLYAPLHDLAALIDGPAAARLAERGELPAIDDADPLRDLVAALTAAPAPEPAPATGPLVPPFLGIIPTRACNLACRYCGFWNGDQPHVEMPLAVAREAVDWYLETVRAAGRDRADVHFFGGEPFSGARVIDFVVAYAQDRGAALGLEVRFEVLTNGVFDEHRCRWIADRFDAVIVSLDGPADVHDRHRPRRGGQGTFETVARNVRILADGPVELCLRACVTADSVGRIEEIAGWLAETFEPDTVCLEALQPTADSEAAGLAPPDPWAFARGFLRAARVLEAHGVEAVYGTADLDARRVSFCPVGTDVAIVSPDRSLAGCYLLEQDWRARGLDLRLGSLDAGGARVEPTALERVRALNVTNEPACAACFCRWHCAGGCHVNHRPPAEPGRFDRLCLQNRVITLGRLLDRLGERELLDRLLADHTALEAVATQAVDLLWPAGATS